MVEIRRLQSNEVALLHIAARLVQKHSWGPDYPLEPMTEMSQSELHIGAFVSDELVGYSGVNRSASPDLVDNGELWFVHAVVHPLHRRSKIWQTMYQERLNYAREMPGRILCCTDNPHVESFLLSQGWHENRKTVDVTDGSPITVFELTNRSP